jgi:hypothetical protein
VDAFNSGIDPNLGASRLTRIKLSSQQINELELALQRRLDKQKVATAADKSTSGSLLSAGALSSTPATNSCTNGDENDSSEDEEIDMHVPIGSNVAFAMVVGTGARVVYQWGIGQIAELLKGNRLRRRAVPLSGGFTSSRLVCCVRVALADSGSGIPEVLLLR